MAVIVQINFDYDYSYDTLLDGANKIVGIYENLDGLLWKTWLVNKDKKITGGIYMFDSMEKALAYTEGPIGQVIRNERENSSILVFDILEGPSRATHAPLPD